MLFLHYGADSEENLPRFLASKTLEDGLSTLKARIGAGDESQKNHPHQVALCSSSVASAVLLSTCAARSGKVDYGDDEEEPPPGRPC